MSKFLIKHSLSCRCGKAWFILADLYSYDFEIEKVRTFIDRVNHRMYECKLSPIRLKKETNMKTAEYWDELKKERIKGIIQDSMITVNHVSAQVYINALTKAVLHEIAEADREEHAYYDEMNLQNQMDTDSRPE